MNMLASEIGIISIGLFCIGAIIGSFLHVVAERYGSGKSALSGRSYCPHCKKSLTALQLVPLFSYIYSRAACMFCKQEIPFHYPVIELLSGILAVALIAPSSIGQSGLVSSVLLFCAACVLLVLIRIDMKLMLLPDRYVGLLGILAVSIVIVSGGSVDDSVLGALVGAGALYGLWLGSGGAGIGFGDVKLMIPLGILFGLRGVVALLFFSFLAGGSVGVFLLATGRATPKTAIPFGPFLAGSALFMMIFPYIADRFFILLGV